MKETVFSVYSYTEIIDRYYGVLSHLEGPSLFPFSIHLNAGNTTEPPVITVELYEMNSQGGDNLVYDSFIDQNSPFNKLEYEIQRLKDEVEFCLYAAENQMSYQDARMAVVGKRKEEEDEMPF